MITRYIIVCQGFALKEGAGNTWGLLAVSRINKQQNRKYDLNMENKVELRELFDSLYLAEKDMTGTQVDFVRSCKLHLKQTGGLSERQVRILRDTLKYLPKDEARYSMKR